MYVFIFLVQFGELSGHLLGNSCSFGLRHVFMVEVLKCHFSFFPTLGLWSVNFFLIAPFPDHCLFVLFLLSLHSGGTDAFCPDTTAQIKIFDNFTFLTTSLEMFETPGLLNCYLPGCKCKDTRVCTNK